MKLSVIKFSSLSLSAALHGVRVRVRVPLPAALHGVRVRVPLPAALHGVQYCSFVVLSGILATIRIHWLLRL